MFTREELRYGKLWVRVLCCMAVAIAVGNAVFFQILTPIENLFKELVMLGEGGDKYMYVSQITEIAVASCMCLLPSIPRIERPIMMILWGIGLMLAYLLVVLGFLLTLDLVLPPDDGVEFVLARERGQRRHNAHRGRDHQSAWAGDNQNRHSGD